jgi:siroheme synthase-like protein
VTVRQHVYPVSLLLAGHPCLVIGGGTVALAKIDGLLDAGAVVTVIAPEVLDEITALPVTVRERRFQAGDTEGFRLVVCATGDQRLDSEVFAACEGSGTLVNAADNPDACTFYLPALLRSGNLSVAISTDGSSPAIASWVRDRIAAALGDRFADVVDIVATTRTELRASGRTSEGLPWSDLIDELASRVRDGASLEVAREIAAAWFEQVGKTTKTTKD